MVDSKEKQLNRNGNRRGMSQNSQNNLHPRLKGNKNANKDYSITRIIKEMLDEPAVERWLEVEDKPKKLTWRQAIAKRILIEATRGNAKVTSELLDRLEGKVGLPILPTGADGEPLVATFVFQMPDGSKFNPSQLATKSKEQNE